MKKSSNNRIENNPDIVRNGNHILCELPFNRIRHFNDFLYYANEVLPEGGTITVRGETSSMRVKRLRFTYPGIIGITVVFFDYLWTRVFSKLALTRWFYMLLTGGKNRNYPRVEVLGRLSRAGFDIVSEKEINGSFYVTGVRKRAPHPGEPFYGLLVRLPRKGKDGKTIRVFKMRTMYAYSEFIQGYTYNLNGLEKGGKIKDDFRVNFMGRFLRKFFLDELPMFINFFKGELKFVGVRPISSQYLSLYTPEMRALRLSVKPGLFPPLYYDYPKPETLEEIQESERRYIESYKAHPLRTDLRYFLGMCRNIIFRRERSH